MVELSVVERVVVTADLWAILRVDQSAAGSAAERADPLVILKVDQWVV